MFHFQELFALLFVVNQNTICYRVFYLLIFWLYSLVPITNNMKVIEAFFC